LRKALEHTVADHENLLATVKSLADSEQLKRVAERADHAVHPGIDRLGRVDGEGDRVARHPVVESRVR
jgi:hypothetical protein